MVLLVGLRFVAGASLSGSVGGFVVGHLGVVNARDLAWADLTLGDFVLRYDASRGGIAGRMRAMKELALPLGRHTEKYLEH